MKVKYCRSCEKNEPLKGRKFCLKCLNAKEREKKILKLKLKKFRIEKKKAKKKEKRENSLSRLKAKCWELCSIYNRMKDADKDGFLKCCTCPKFVHWKKLQGGHFVPGRGNAVLFDNRGVHAQCYQCNVEKKGQWVEYEKFMIERYGQEVVNELKANKFKIKIITVEGYKQMIEFYKNEIRKLSTLPPIATS